MFSTILKKQKFKTLLIQKEYHIALAYDMAAPIHVMLQGLGRCPRTKNLDRRKGKHFATNKQPALCV